MAEVEPEDEPLPGWRTRPLGDVVKARKGKRPNDLKPGAVGVPYLSLSVMEGEDPSEYVDEHAATMVDAGDVVIVWDGARSGMPVLVPRRGALVSTMSHLYSDDVSNEYLYFFLLSQWRVVNEAPRGSGIPHINPDILWQLELPIPPRSEQGAMAERAQELRSRVSMIASRLYRAAAVVEVFRRAVLRAGTTGASTAAWRAKAQSATECPSIEALQARRRAGGRRVTIRDDIFEGLPELPPKWRWVPLPLIGEFGRGKSRHRPRNDKSLYGGDYPFVQTGDVAQSNGLITSHRQTYNEKGLAQSKLWPTGTVLITIAANIANSAVLTYPACFPDSVVGVVPDKDVCEAEYLEYFIRTAQSDLSQFAPATTLANINLSILSEIAVPIPPVEEQREVVASVARGMELAQDIEVRVVKASALAYQLTDASVLRALKGPASSI